MADPTTDIPKETNPVESVPEKEETKTEKNRMMNQRENLRRGMMKRKHLSPPMFTLSPS